MRRRGYATKVVAGAVLAGVMAGCNGAPAVPRGSVTSCTQFGVAAIRRHATVTSVPAACRGLSQVEVNVAVGRALRTAAAGARGKVRQRELIARDSPYLDGLVRAVPSAGRPAVAAPLSGSPSRAALSLAALAAWLVTVGLGVSMMARWITRTRQRRRGRRRGRQPLRGRGGQPRLERGPVLNFTHLGLALTGLATWICYLVTGVTGLAWAACGLLILVAAVGMTLVFPARDRAPTASPVTALAGPPPPPVTALPGPPAPPVTALPGPAAPPASRRAPVLVIAAHITAASVTILLALLAAVGSG